MAATGIVEHVSLRTDSSLPFSSEEHIRHELESLADELREVEQRIAAVRTTLYGLSVIYGAELVGQEVMQVTRPSRRARRGAITEGCLSVLGEDQHHAYFVAEIFARLKIISPETLIHQRNPMASVMSVLRSLAARGHVTRSNGDGKSAWQLAGTRQYNELSPSTARECFQ
jgi:hypothetical protein